MDKRTGFTLTMAQPSLGVPMRQHGDKFAVALNAVAVRKRRAQKRWSLPPTTAREPVSGSRSLATPAGRASA